MKIGKKLSSILLQTESRPTGGLPACHRKYARLETPPHPSRRSA